MQTITILTTQILDGIYARSALSTLSAECRMSILHPDHADALRHVIGDAISVVVASAKAGTIKIKSISDEAYTLEISEGTDPVMASRLIRTATVSAALRIILEAAGLPAPELEQLDALEPSPATCGRVKPFI